MVRWTMPTVPTDDQGEEPLVPVYPYNEPGADIQLYAGPLVEADDQQWRGRILLTCGSRLAVVWRLDEIPSDRWAWNALRETDVHLQIRQGPDRHEVAGLRRTLTEGTLHAQSIGSDETALRRVLYHWMNLPPVHSPGLLRRRGRDGRSTWTGRSRLELGPWQLTLDRRSDHPRIWETLASEHNFAMTHVMQVSRADGADFTVEELEPLQLALHFGMSFAFGRWVAPAAPVGFDSAGAMVWRHWASVFCEPGRDGGLAWLHYPDSHDLGDFLSRTYDAFADPDRSHTLKLLLSMAVEVNRAGRVEQRTMTAFSALELLTWVVLKLTGGMSKNQYGALRAHGRIRTMLEAA
ncbi:hypothetical protein [Amycolatopsis sp. NPDC006125]|uniref:hypothetical protein n=1 Tax=Amycolatopsis sp. NPDC006125 TaxID=3156730 RepID=UPI00339F906A